MEMYSNFSIRLSGKHENSFYIDYMGKYKVNDIAAAVGVESDFIIETYAEKGAVYDKELSVHYFSSEADAKEAIRIITEKSGTRSRERIVSLSEAEIECIRKALINEGSNMIYINSKIKDSIFKKLNG